MEYLILLSRMRDKLYASPLSFLSLYMVSDFIGRIFIKYYLDLDFFSAEYGHNLCPSPACSSITVLTQSFDPTQNHEGTGTAENH